jgi:hypothetical protein
MNAPVTKNELREAVSEGFRDAISDPAFWDAAMTAIQSRAQQEAGGWLLGGVKKFLQKAAWILVIGLGLYLVGGWAALVAFIKANS